MIRVYLVDDHHVMRQAVASLLEAEDDITVIGQSGDAEEGIKGVKELKPSVAIVDLKMPGMSGLTAIGEISAASPDTGILVFTMHDNPAYVWQSMNSGASGYILKNASKDDLLRAVRAVHSKAGYLQAEITRPLLKRLAHDAKTADKQKMLTGREMQVLEILAEGGSNKMIAAELEITEETVKTHLKKLYHKLGAADRAHAVAIALRQRLID